MRIIIIVMAIIGACSVLGVSLSGLLRKSADAVEKGQEVVQSVAKSAERGYSQATEVVNKGKSLKEKLEK
jgi:uncharacterized protein YoxC